MGPFLSTTIVSGDTIPVGSPASIPCLVACSPIATVNSVFSFQPGSDPRPVVGMGMYADMLLYLLRDSNQVCNVVCAAPTWSAAPNVTHLDASGGNNPTGPAVTCALGAGQPGCLDDHNLVLRVTVAGGLGAGQVSLAYDGGAGVESFTLPSQGPASLTGSVAITPTTLATASGLTLVFDQPASKTLTFASPSLAAAPAGLLVATATVAAPVTVLAAAMLSAGLAAIAAHGRLITFTSAGTTPAHVPATATITGTDATTGLPVTEVVTLATTAATVSSVHAYVGAVSVVYTTAGGIDATVSIGYSSAYASVAELIAEANAIAVASPIAIVATASQTSAGYFLTWATTAVSTSAVLTFDASPGTGAALFGFTTAETVTGTNATYPLPKAGLVLTFATGTYPVAESYVMPCVGPRMSVSSAVNAMAAAIAAYATNPFGFAVVAQPADSAANCQAMVSALETQRLATLNATVPRAYYVVVGSPWHVASTNYATNQANITTADGALLTAFTGSPVSANSVGHDDGYVSGSNLLALGSFRRSAAICMALKRASANRIAATVAEGFVPEVSLIAGDGVTYARDQNTATVQLQGLQGPGFFCLKTADDSGDVKFALGATRAGTTSRLQHDGDFAVCAEAAREIWGVVKPWEGQRPGLDPITGQMADHEKMSRVGQVDDVIRPFLLPTGNTDARTPIAAPLPNCTDFGIVVNNPPTGLFQNNGITPVVCTITTLGTIQQVVVTIAASGVTTIAAPAST